MIGKILKMKNMDFNIPKLEDENNDLQGNVLLEKSSDKKEIVKPIRSIEKLVKTFHHEQKIENQRESKELKWKYASVVLDRYI